MTEIDNNINLLGLLDSAPMCIKLFNGDGKLIFINKYGREEHHIADTDDISKWNWRGTIEKEYLPAVEKSFNAILAGSPIENVDLKHTKEGSTHEWCSGALSSVKDSAGKVIGVLFYSIDATAKKHAEENVLAKMTEIENMNKFMIDREVKMADLKEVIKELESKCEVAEPQK